MRRFYLNALGVTLLAASGMAFCQVTPEEYGARHPPQQTTKTDTNGKSDTGATSSAQADQEKMRALMDKVHQTKDPAERKRLLEQHQRLMHEELQAMQQMKCPMIGFDGSAPSGKAPPDTAKGTGGGTKGGGLMGADSKNCHQMMETRMDMTAALLEQMLEHEEAER